MLKQKLFQSYQMNLYGSIHFRFSYKHQYLHLSLEFIGDTPTTNQVSSDWLI